MTGQTAGRSVLVMRHAKAESPETDTKDHDRRLTDRGRRDSGRIGRLLREEGLLPDLIITSTATRARETAEALAAAGGYAGDMQRKRALYLAGSDACIRILSALEASHLRVLVIAHNPGVEALVQLLTGASTTMPTAALVEIALPIQSWRELNERTRGDVRGVWRPRDLD